MRKILDTTRFQAVFRRLYTKMKTIQKAREAFLELASRVFACVVVKWWSIALGKELLQDRGNSRVAVSPEMLISEAQF